MDVLQTISFVYDSIGAISDLFKIVSMAIIIAKAYQAYINSRMT